MRASFRIGLLGMAVAGCVPSGSAPPTDAGAAATAVAPPKPSQNVMRTAFEDTFERGKGGRDGGAGGGGPDAGARTASGDGGPDGGRSGGGDAASEGGSPSASAAPPSASAAPPASSGAADEGDLGPDWSATGGAWRIENGRLCGQNARNHGVWLTRTLPVNARIEFDATSYSVEGDLKVEVWGDGRSSATGISYTNATSYLAIFGGWKNTVHVLARLDEHASDRKEIRVDPTSDDARQRAVNAGQTYRFKVERTDGRKVRWFVDGVEYLSYDDPAPLTGQGHDHFGFNDWAAKVCFDNVKVTPL